MIQVVELPTLNAVLNTISATLLIIGYVSIKRGERDRHRLCMLGAVLTSVLFLTSYLIYHYNAGSRSFEGEGSIRVLYFAILLTHIVLAAVNVPFVETTLIRALRGNFDGHRRIAKWTLPLWLYVSVTGVLVYWMLYGM